MSLLQNSVRHNLSLSKCFARVPDTGVGIKSLSSQWTVNPLHFNSLRNLVNKARDRALTADKAESERDASPGRVVGAARPRKYLGNVRASPVASPLARTPRTLEPRMSRSKQSSTSSLTRTRARCDSFSMDDPLAEEMLELSRQFSAPVANVDFSSSSDNDTSEMDGPVHRPDNEYHDVWEAFEGLMLPSDLADAKWSNSALSAQLEATGSYEAQILTSAASAPVSAGFEVNNAEMAQFDGLFTAPWDSADCPVIAFDSIDFQFPVQSHQEAFDTVHQSGLKEDIL
jgi:hypothetical protein